MGVRIHEDALTTTDGWKEGNLVARMERSIPGSEFLIARSDNGGAEFCELGIFSGVKSKELFDCGGVGNVQGFFSMSSEVFETAEEEDLDANGL